MVGRLDRNLRRGHRAEDLGIEMLKAFCAVAPVQHTEDIGFDAVATVLRPDGRFLYAERTFCVQFKARSVRQIQYSPDAYRWLRALDLPLFIGSVDLDNRAVELFTTHNVVHRVDARGYQAATMYLDARSCRIDEDRIHQGLGAPVLRWEAADCESSEVRDQAYRVLSAWTALEHVNRQLSAIHTTRLARWTTGEPPDVPSTGVIGHADDLAHDIAAAEPYLSKLASHFVLREEPSVEQLGFYLLVKWLAEHGNELAGTTARMVELIADATPVDLGDRM